MTSPGDPASTVSLMRSTAHLDGPVYIRIAEGVGMFLDDTDGWLRFSTYPVHEAAVRLHQRLLAIRPWSNGNGRHARLMADIIVASHGEKALTWGFRPRTRCLLRWPGPGGA